MKYGLGILFALILTIPRSDIAAQDATTVLGDLRSTYDAITGLKADFSQTMNSEYMNEPQETSGTLVLMGDKYRVEAGVQTIVTDGEFTWVYNAAEDQLIINDYEEDETTFSISDFFQTFDERYTVQDLTSTSTDGVEHHILALTPTDPASFFTGVTLWVRATDNIITRLQIMDANETEMTFGLDEIQINPEIAPDSFSFTPDDGTDVVDLRS
ncbi:MAG: outer membrane lipoprotein carrier protein LolA [Rhodothermales bacterium]|nr:outer membrane lipoprotein carrier protein LolA [Rhodothermales bacterium]